MTPSLFKVAAWSKTDDEDDEGDAIMLSSWIDLRRKDNVVEFKTIWAEEMFSTPQKKWLLDTGEACKTTIKQSAKAGNCRCRTTI
jgi:hypothetical protein